MEIKWINTTSFLVAGTTFLFAFLLFFSQTNEPVGSASAALIASALAWIAYVICRFIILALKK